PVAGVSGVWGTPGRPPVLTKPGESQSVLWNGRLVRDQDGQLLRLSYVDNTAGNWHFVGLSPGKYRLSFQYENTAKGLADFLKVRPVLLAPGQSFWLGKAATGEVEFEITAPP